MSGLKNWRFIIAAFAILALVTAGMAFGQAQRGNVYGNVMDDTGNALPGVTVELSGIGATRVQVTDAQGGFRFPALDPGRYSVTATLEGFSTVEFPNVTVGVGRNTTLQLQLTAAVEEVITVTSESPLLDERKLQAGTSISRVELEKIPTARDPWAIVTQTKGVVSDRINVGGNESGQQANFNYPGTSGDNNTFSVDGVVITDMAATGASPTYYDFDQFEEMQVTTGGSDIEKISAGVALNLVTKRGSNTPRGSARFLLTDGQDTLFGVFKPATPSIPDGDLGGGQTRDDLTPNEINQILDFGFEGGGAILRDRLWAWGSYGRNDIKQISGNGLPDNTLLENTAIKLNAQLAASNSGVFSWNRGDKIKDGRQANNFVTSESSWDQSGPTEIWKIDDTRVFSSSFYLTGMFSTVDGGFQLITKGAGLYPYPPNTDSSLAASQGESVWDNNFSFQNGFYSGASDRNVDNYQLDGSYFFNTGNSNHELKFGISYRAFESESNFGWDGGRNLINVQWAGEVWASRSGAAPVESTYTATWLQDTITWGNFTFNAGLRYDVQDGKNGSSTVLGNPEFPNLLPTLNFGGNDGGGFSWKTLSPRLGVTWALGPERKTLLRASYARFADQLGTGNISRVNPLGTATATYQWNDLNGNTRYDAGEAGDLVSWGGFDPSDPTSLTSPNITDPGLSAPVTDELIFGVEHALLPEFVVGADVTYRVSSDIMQTRTLVRDGNGAVRPSNRGDYVLSSTEGVTLPDGSTGTGEYYTLANGLTRTGGSLLQNGGREVTYLGYGVNFTKRLANRWMARGYVNFGEAEWDVPAATLAEFSPNIGIAAGQTDGELWVERSGGSGPFGNVFLQSGWTWNLNGMYQVAPDRPWGFNVAANLFGREGYPIPYSNTQTGVPQFGSVENRVTPNVDNFRNDNVFTFDLRIEKDMPLSDSLSSTFSLDVFNVLNDNTVLQREIDANSGQQGWIFQTIAPRVWRLGFRLSWR